MDPKELKKILAGFAVAGLLASVGAPGATQAAEDGSSLTGGNSGAGSTQATEQKAPEKAKKADAGKKAKKKKPKSSSG